MKYYMKTLSLLLVLALVFAWLPVTASAATKVSGTVNASRLADNAELELTGMTTLVMNTDRKLKSISGSAALRVEGTGLLTVENQKGHAISVKSITSTAPMTVLASKDGLNIDQSIDVRNKLFIISGGDGIYSRNGSIALDGSITINADENAIEAPNGDIEIKGPSLKAASTSKKLPCIQAGHADSKGFSMGDIVISSESIELSSVNDAVFAQCGSISVTSGSAVISSKNDSAIRASIVDATGIGGGIYGDGKVTLDGQFKLSGDEYSVCAIGDFILKQGAINAAGSLYAYKNINLNGNIQVEASEGKEAIWAKNGNITVIGSVTAKATGKKVSAIQAGYADNGGFTIGNITLRGESINVSSVDDAIFTHCGLITIAGKAKVTSSKGDAVYAGGIDATGIGGSAYTGGIVIESGFLEASGSEAGVNTYGTLEVKENAGLQASGSKYGVYAHGGFKISSALKITVPSGGRISGETVVNAGGTTATLVQIGTPAISGTVNLDTAAPSPGSWVRYKLSGEVFQLYRNGVKLTAQWQESPNGETGWTDVTGDTDSSGTPVYVCDVGDLGKYLRVTLTAEGYKGYLTSTPRLVSKSACYVDVTAPKLIISSNKVFVNNARTNQQYLMFNYKKNIDALAESDWASAVTPEVSGLLDLGGTVGRTYYVYTRVMGSSIMEAGTDVRSAAIYLGETVSLQDFTLTVTDKNGTALEQENGNTYYCKINEPVRIAVEPIPSNATFNGIYFNNWINNAKSGAFYEDAACTKALQSGQYYKLVYFKPTQARNGADIAAEFTRGYNDVIHTGFYLNVADSSGNWLAVSASSLRITAKVGETVEAVPVTSYPSKAGLKGMTVQLRNGDGTAPVLTLRPETKTVDVDATKADLGVFYYDLYQNGTKITGGFTVEVVTEPVEAISLLPETLTGEPGMSYELAVQCYPSGATGEAFWATSNSKVATVSKGVVTFASGAEIGQSATITATVNGHKATCLVTVAGEAFDLMVDGIKVTTGNMDDILGNGVFSFDGFRTLSVSGSYTGSSDVITNNGIENLVIRAETDSVLTCTREDKNPILLRADTTITGPGKLTLSGGDSGVYLTKMDGTLTIRDAALDITGNWGIGGTNMKNEAVLVIDHSDIIVDSGYGAVCDFGGGITLADCEIVQPTDGKISDDGKDIADEAGTRCTKVQIQATARANPFEDVAEGTYYYDAVLWAVNHNPQITNGTDETHFSPNATCTRGQVVTFLWRAAGEPEPTGDKNPFTDVKSGAYYYKAVLWAVENGITKGTSTTTFSPDQGCTRGQVVTFLHRFENSPAPGSTANPFTDVKPGAFYYDAVLWAVEKGVTKGTSATAFSPNQTCTRAQIVTFLYRDMK